LKFELKIFQDKSGTISKLELKVMFGGNNKVDDSVWTDLIKEVDINGDGEVHHFFLGQN
jgi:calcium-dependent protein kinase